MAAADGKPGAARNWRQSRAGGVASSLAQALCIPALVQSPASREPAVDAGLTERRRITFSFYWASWQFITGAQSNRDDGLSP